MDEPTLLKLFDVAKVQVDKELCDLRNGLLQQIIIELVKGRERMGGAIRKVHYLDKREQADCLGSILYEFRLLPKCMDRQKYHYTRKVFERAKKLIVYYEQKPAERYNLDWVFIKLIRIFWGSIDDHEHALECVKLIDNDDWKADILMEMLRCVKSEYSGDSTAQIDCEKIQEAASTFKDEKNRARNKFLVSLVKKQVKCHIQLLKVVKCAEMIYSIEDRLEAMVYILSKARETDLDIACQVVREIEATMPNEIKSGSVQVEIQKIMIEADKRQRWDIYQEMRERIENKALKRKPEELTKEQRVERIVASVIQGHNL